MNKCLSIYLLMVLFPCLAQQIIFEQDFQNQACNTYVIVSKPLQCLKNQELIVRVEAKSPDGATLGALLHQKAGKKTVLTIHPNENWQTKVGNRQFKEIEFTFLAGSLKQTGNYDLSLYRSNHQGTIFIRKITAQQIDSGKKIYAFFDPSPDLISPKGPGKSGISDYHLRITGVNPDKAIRKVVVRDNAGGQWSSVNEDVKKGIWYAQYYDSIDFVKKTHSKNNFNSAVHKGIAGMDILMESFGVWPSGITFSCEVWYEDNSKDSWQYVDDRSVAPPVPQHFSHTNNLLVAREDFRVPEIWHLPFIGNRTFWHLMDPPETFSTTLIDAKTTEQLWRVYSPAYFFPLTERRPDPNQDQMQWLKIPTVGYAALREFQVFDSQNREISRSATVSAECPQELLDLGFVNDGDTTLKKNCLTTQPAVNGCQTITLVLDFRQEYDLDKIILHHGSKNGSAVAWIAKDFILQYWQKNHWETLPNGMIWENSSERTEHAAKGIKTSRLALKIETQEQLYDYGRFDWNLNNKLLDINKTDEIPPEVPFFYWYLGHDAVINFALPEKFAANLEIYNQWRMKHPLFLGFQLVEFDSDLADFLGLSWRQKHKAAAQRAYDHASKRLSLSQTIPQPPTTREEAVNQIKELFNRYKALLFDEASFFTSATIWSHYGLEWGAVNTTSEMANALAFSATRGASRQYGNKPWGAYYESYCGGLYATNYLKSFNSKTSGYGPTCGKSPSLYRRRMFLGYLMGVNFVDYESPYYIFPLEKPDEGREIKLSPHGSAAREVYEFDKKNPERGVPYTPLALVLDWTHGWRQAERTKIFFGHFPPTLADRHIDVWMRGIYRIGELPRESHGFYMSQTGFSGICDIMLLNPPSGCPDLNPYKAVILAGNLHISENTAAILKQYVYKGGTLVLDVTQIQPHFNSSFTGFQLTRKSANGTKAFTVPGKQALPGKELPYEFAETELESARALVANHLGQPLVTVNSHGLGNVVVTLQKYLIETPLHPTPKEGLSTVHYLLSLLRHELLPFQLSSDRPAEITVSRLPNGWRLGIINNQGVYSDGKSAPLINEKESVTQTIAYKGRLRSAVERITGQMIPFSEQSDVTSLTWTVAPGEVAIIDMLE